MKKLISKDVIVIQGETMKNCEECPKNNTKKCWVEITGEVRDICPELKVKKEQIYNIIRTPKLTSADRRDLKVIRDEW